MSTNCQQQLQDLGSVQGSQGNGAFQWWEVVRTLIKPDRREFWAIRMVTGETSGCFCSFSLTGELTSSACVRGCVVDGVSATAAT